LDGVSVTVNGKSAFVSYISPMQINAQAPDDTTTGTVPVVVTNNGVASASATVILDEYSPALFTFQGNYAVATRTNFSWAVRPGEFLGVTTTPAVPNDVIILWGTGFGPTSPHISAGQKVPASGQYTLTAPPIRVPANAPANAPDGDLPVAIAVNGRTSPNGVFLTIKNPTQILAPSNLQGTAKSATMISLAWTDPVSIGLNTHLERST
jgi:hypothetical protein